MSAPTNVRRLRSSATIAGGARSTATLVAGAIVVPVVAVPWAVDEPWWVEVGLVATLLMCVVAAMVDTINRRIPDRVVLTSLAPVVAVLAVRVANGGADTIVPRVLLGVALFVVPLLAVHLIAPDALGFGDVKLAVPLGIALGLVDWRYALAALCLASGLTAAVAMIGRRSTMPFAPGLVAGTALVLLLPTLEGHLPWR
jgi:leader peptidase (prepilin peptidase) / N-methyltransferase